MSRLDRQIAENLANVRGRIAEAAARSGRNAEDITLVAVAKYVNTATTQSLIAAGCHDLGESRPQELWAKAAEIQNDNIRWHQIGHLQRNKARKTVQIASLIHSGDNLRLLKVLNEISQELQKRTSVLLEVNISGDESKHGFPPDALVESLPEIAALEHLEIRGLMAMASREGGPEKARRDFAQLRELRNRLQAVASGEVTLADLSMGMSGDFEIAIDEGATIVRVGSALFEGIDNA